MIALVEGASRQKTPNEIALNILLASLTIIFLLATVTLQPLAIFAKANQPGIPDTAALDGNGITGIVLVSLLVCLIPTTIGALLSAIGIAGMDRLVQRNVLAMSGRAVEAAGDVNTLLLDKTGTITLGNRQATEFLPVGDGARSTSWPRRPSCPRWPTRPPRAARSSCWPRTAYGLRERAPGELSHASFVPFTRPDPDERGRPDRLDGQPPAGPQGRRRRGHRLGPRAGRQRAAAASAELVDGISAGGGTPLVVAEARATRAAGARRHPAQGRRQAGHARAVRRAAPDGHPHRHDHRRQPADRARRSPTRPASTTSWPRPRPRTRWR